MSASFISYSESIFLEPAIRQNSYGLYILYTGGGKIRKDKNNLLLGMRLSEIKVINGKAFFIMTVYRGK